MDRRHFIQTLAGATFGARTLRAGDLERSLGEPQGLPRSLPHFESIQVYPVRNCKHILVHIRQSHESNHDQVMRLARGTVSERTARCQTSIRKGIGRFLEALPCNAIYVEGLRRSDVEMMRGSVSGFRDVTREQERFRAKIVEAKRIFQSPGARSESELEKVRSLEASVARFDVVIDNTVKVLDQESISHSTAIQVAAAHNLIAESPNTPPVERFLERFAQPYDELQALNKRVLEKQRRAGKIVEMFFKDPTASSASAQKELLEIQAELESAVTTKMSLAERITRQLESEERNIFTLREEAVVSLIAARPIGLNRIDCSLVLFGAKHDFLPEVEAYNARYRDNGIALVVVTPFGLEGAPEK